MMVLTEIRRNASIAKGETGGGGGGGQDAERDSRDRDKTEEEGDNDRDDIDALHERQGPAQKRTLHVFCRNSVRLD